MLLKLSKFFLYASVFCILVVMTSAFFPFIGGKTYFFRTAIQLSVIFLLFWWAFEAPAGELSARIKDMFKKPLFIAVTAFAAAFLLATFFANDMHAAFWSNYERGEGGLQMLHYYLFFFLAVLLFREKKDWEMLFWCALFAAAGMILYGIGAAVLIVNPDTGAASNPFGFVGPYGYSAKGPSATFWGRLFHTERFQGSLGNPAYVSPYILFSIFYLAWLWLSEKGRNMAKNISYGALALLFVTFFWAAQTRGAFAGLIAAVFVFFTVLALDNPKLRKKALIAVAVAAVVIGSLVYFSQSSFIKNIPGSRQFELKVSDQTFQTRLWTWNSAWQGFKERPVFGWGPENFSGVFDKFFDPRHYVPGKPSETWFDYAHSIVFDYLAETGIIGFLSFMAIFLVFYMELAKRFKSENPVMKPLLAALPASYLVQGLVLFNVLPMYINIFLFMSFACYELYYSKKEHAETHQSHQ